MKPVIVNLDRPLRGRPPKNWCWEVLPIITPGQITRRVKELAKQIRADYLGQNPVVVGVMNGSFIFLADLLRALEMPVQLDFVSVSSYRDGTSPGGLKVTKKPSCSLRNRHVIVVDDILDTGRTLRFIVSTLRPKKPASIRTCVLLDKPACRQVEIRAHYVGFQIPNRFVVGYGLDKVGWYRNLRFVGVTRDQIAAG